MQQITQATCPITHCNLAAVFILAYLQKKRKLTLTTIRTPKTTGPIMFFQKEKRYPPRNNDTG